MKIVSIIKESFMEYENFISLVLFCFGCNMKCSYCYNYDFVIDNKNVFTDPIESIIDNNISKLTDGLVFLGGEPTIYGNRLLEIASYAKNKHNLSVKLFTNCTNPSLILDGLDHDCFDYISVDFKAYFPTLNIFYNDAWVNYLMGLDYFLKGIVSRGLEDKLEIRMTKVKGLEKDSEIIKDICEQRGILFIPQTDVRKSYKEINVLE